MWHQRRMKRWSRHGPPPWWPEDEPWPPSRRDWRRSRKKLFPRAIFGAFVALFISTALCSGSIYLIQALVSGLDLPASPLTIPIGLGVFAFLLFTVVAGRNLGRFFSPLDSLLEASERLSAGDMSVQVRERGGPEMRALIRAFNEMAEQLRIQSEDRQNLLAEVTHELRTPLTIIRGNIEGMRDGVYDINHDQLGMLLTETARMSELIEDLRILALAERGGLLIRKEFVDIPQLVGEIVSSVRSKAEEREVKLKQSYAEDLPLIEVDPLRIGQVLTNLLNNALQHTQSGGEIDIQVGTTDKREMKFSIVDDGAGINPEDLPHIFERFYKSESSEGSGLGLAIVKSLVEAHGGAVSASSDPEVRTRIAFTLPFDPI